MIPKQRLLLYCLLCAFASVWGQSEIPYYQLGLTDTRFSIESMQAKGDSFYRQKQYDSALYWQKKAFTSNLNSGRFKEAIETSFTISSSYRQLGLYEEEIHTLEQILPYCNIINNTLSDKAYVYNLMAVNFSYRGRFEESIKYYEMALTISSGVLNPEIPPETVLNNIAALYVELNMPDKAIVYLKRVDSILQINPDKNSKVTYLFTYANLYDKASDFTKAKNYLDTLIPLANEIENYVAEYVAFWKLADIAVFLKNLEEAAYYLDLMQKLITKTHDLEPALIKRYYKTKAHLHILQKDYAQALKEYQSSLYILEKIRSKSDLSNTYQYIARTYSLMHKYKEAFDAEQIAKAYNDSLNLEKQMQSIATMEARYQSIQKDKAIAEKDRAIAQKELLIYKQNNAIFSQKIIIGTTILFIIFLVIVYFIILKNNRQKQKLKDEKILLTIREQELKQIRTIMDVEEQERTRIARDIHDGLMIKFSTLMMNLSALFDGDKGKDIYLEQLDGAISSLRNVAHNLMPDVLLEGGLSEAIYYFCENLKEEVNFDIAFNFLNEIPRFDEKFELSVYRIVQELMQNIVKHAKAKEAYIQIGYSDDLLHITIEDNGIGMDVQEKSNSGLGLKSIQNRLIALNGNMEISSENNAGTSIVLEFFITKL